MDLIQWQAMELEQLKEQVREQKAASIDQTRVIKNLEAAVSHLTRTDRILPCLVFVNCCTCAGSIVFARIHSGGRRGICELKWTFIFYFHI